MLRALLAPRVDACQKDLQRALGLTPPAPPETPTANSQQPTAAQAETSSLTPGGNQVGEGDRKGYQKVFFPRFASPTNILGGMGGSTDIGSVFAAVRGFFCLSDGGLAANLPPALFAALDAGETDPAALLRACQGAMLLASPAVRAHVAPHLLLEVDQRTLRGSDAVPGLQTLRFVLKPPWPFSMLLSSQALEAAAQVLVLVLQLQRARAVFTSLALTDADDDAFPDPDEEKPTVAGRDQITLPDAAPGAASVTEGYSGSVTAAFHRSRELAGKRMKSWRVDREFVAFFLLKQQLSAFLGAVDSHMRLHVLEAPWRLLQQQLATLQHADLAHIAGLHDEYCQQVLHEALLSKRLSVAASAIRRLLSLAFDLTHFSNQLLLPFRKHPTPALRMAALRQIAMLRKEFDDNLDFLMEVVTKVSDSGVFPHLENLLMMLNFNRFYSEKSVPRQVSNFVARKI